VIGGLNVTDISCGMILRGANGINSVGGYHNVNISTTDPNWTDIVVTLVIPDEKPARDVYPVCKTAQTHTRK
jgi:hypothetical protein